MLSVTEITNTTDKEAELLWKQCLIPIKETLPPITFSTWFAPIKPVSYTNNRLTVKLPGSFFYEWLDEHYKTLIDRSVKNALGEKAELSYLIASDTEESDFHVESEPIKIDPVTEVKPDKSRNHFDSKLNTLYTFDNFIKGEGNQLARAAAQAISENPGGTSFNPFFVYGGVGLGKTHLVQAIGNRILESWPEKKVRYTSAGQFTIDFVEAISKNEQNEFSNFYRSIDVLIIDDIQSLVGKDKTQDLFFNIFNTLHQSKKQIILTSDKPPKDLKGLDDRMISRFNWGLTADIQPPDLETRIAILTSKAERLNMFLSLHIIEYIATHITSNIRELEGCLIKLLAYMAISSKEIDLDITKKIVREISTSRKVQVSIDIITQIVCAHLGVEEDKVREKTRKAEVVFARQVCMYISKEMTKSSLKTIGLHFGGRDHSTVIHSCAAIEEMVIRDSKTREVINTLKNKVEIACL
ncbi:MAG: chromosomal replication initiator protein DnaA [Ignavibacteriales bacterium]|nr:chromosomal replication initiator protein DnaA [Ignavibacteriales bacterium]HOJ18498.1 chromosomal replication initiator protein DnaA [Ignavibacteriaceae bacterium]